MCRKTTALTENTVIIRLKKKGVSQQCRVSAYGSPEKKRSLTFVKVAASQHFCNFSSVVLLTR